MCPCQLHCNSYRAHFVVENVPWTWDVLKDLYVASSATLKGSGKKTSSSAGSDQKKNVDGGHAHTLCPTPLSDMWWINNGGINLLCSAKLIVPCLLTLHVLRRDHHYFHFINGIRDCGGRHPDSCLDPDIPLGLTSGRELRVLPSALCWCHQIFLQLSLTPPLPGQREIKPSWSHLTNILRKNYVTGEELPDCHGSFDISTVTNFAQYWKKKGPFPVSPWLFWPRLFFCCYTAPPGGGVRSHSPPASCLAWPPFPGYVNG